VHKAELVLRTADYHPIQERFQFANNRELEVTELAYEVRPPDPADDYAEMPKPIPATTSANKNRCGQRRSARQLGLAEHSENAEMMARLVLHREEADLGEQITIQRQQSAVTVSGIVETPERKTELTSALKRVEGVSVQLNTIEEVVAQLSEDRQRKTTILPTVVPFEPPLLADELKAKFPDDNQRQEYVAKVLALCDKARSHAFALRGLANRYSANAEAMLGVVSQQELDQLVREHEAAVRDEQEQLQNILEPFMNVGVSEPQGVPTSPSALWRRHAEMLVDELQREHKDLVALFAISNAQAGSVQATTDELSASIRVIGRSTYTLGTSAVPPQ
jgi:hypothetical protein